MIVSSFLIFEMYAHFSEQNLQEFPKEVFDSPNLHTLNLDSNKIECIPQGSLPFEFKTVQKLQTLSL